MLIICGPAKFVQNFPLFPTSYFCMATRPMSARNSTSTAIDQTDLQLGNFYTLIIYFFFFALRCDTTEPIL